MDLSPIGIILGATTTADSQPYIFLAGRTPTDRRLGWRRRAELPSNRTKSDYVGPAIFVNDAR